MNTSENNPQKKEEKVQDQTKSVSTETNDLEEDGSPVLDEADLEELGLTPEEADEIEWEEPKGDTKK